jgi:hypothetical protein
MSVAKEEIAVKKLILVAGLCAVVCEAQLVVSEGTKIRARLESTISSATAEEGQMVELSVTDPVKVGDRTIFSEGARVTGTITEAHEKRRMGRAGKLDFSIDRAKATDGQWVSLRYTVTKKSGESHAVQNGIITAGVAVVFWPAAPVILLAKGKDIIINKGVIFDVYTDSNHSMGESGPVRGTEIATLQSGGASQRQFATTSSDGSTAGNGSVTITSNYPGADIEVGGAFMGNTPTTIQLAGGAHKIVVKGNGRVWERTLQVNAGSTISLSAVLK